MDPKKRLVLFVTDKGFLVPTLSVARQVIRQNILQHADVYIYLVDVEKALQEKVQQDFAPYGIKFVALENKDFLPSGDTRFRTGHVPYTTLARLVLTDFIPEQYEHILYLDGDTQLVGDITPLVLMDVPEGKIATVNGSMWLKHGKQGFDVESYLKGLGGVTAEEYFNAGVLAFRRSTWAEMGPAALKFFFDNSEACYFHDQSALNATCKGRRVALPPAYNFHSEYAKLLVQYLGYKPRIVHFTGKTKPWSYAVLPWGARFARPYVDLVTEYPYLREYLKVSPPASLLWQFLRDGKGLLQLLKDFSAMRKNAALFRKYVKTTDFYIQ